MLRQYLRIAYQHIGKLVSGSGPASGSAYLRPGGVDYYKRPGGTDFYIRP